VGRGWISPEGRPVYNGNMGFWRAIVCVVMPPLAVIDKGCGSFLIVLCLTVLGWVPGIIGALVICTREVPSGGQRGNTKAA
jgi:uncharacterized membrane protein YqaE (UPF0057 family)